jgi:hypothetical protein
VVVVDSSVWIDFYNARPSAGREVLRGLLGRGEIRIVVPDLVLFEVLRGFRHERDLRTARALMSTLAVEPTGEPAIAGAAVDHYRALRSRGHTVRSGIDVLVATFCIERGYALLHDDRDFDAFESLRGLRVWRH